MTGSPIEELAYVRETPITVDTAVERLTSELQRRGFGVLARIAVHETLKEKIGATIDPVVILEVCSPRHAETALRASRWTSLLLPCKIVVAREEGRSRISLVRPTQLLGRFLPLPDLESLGIEVETTLRQCVDATVDR
ncbi:MAG: DUF302 domain-containing protein [Thermoplasmata archaeon]